MDRTDSTTEASTTTVSSATTISSSSTPLRMHLSQSACVAVREMLEEEDFLEKGGLRISAHFGVGCSTPLRFGLVLESDAEPDDLVLSGDGVRIFVDPKSAWALDGLRVDYVDSPAMGTGFAFQHPRGQRLRGKDGRSC